MNERVRQQGGWAGSFVIIGIVLVLLLLGGVYFLKSNEVSDKLAIDMDSSSSKEDADQDKKDQNTPSKDQAKTDDGAKTEPQDTTKGTDEKTTDSATGSHEATESDDAHAKLPQTGPADTAATFAVFAALTYSVVVYLRSRGRLTL